MLLIIRIQIVQRKAVVTGEEIDAGIITGIAAVVLLVKSAV